MKKLVSILILSTLIIPFARFNANAGEFDMNTGVKVIYGDDDRLDYNKMSDSMKTLADSVVSLWKSMDVSLEGDSYRLYTSNFGRAVNLCPEERFREQKIGAFCSGSLVGEDLIMTAGHCITDEEKCKDTKFVFGFAIKDAEKGAPDRISREEVYSCKNIVTRFLGDELDEGDASNLGADYALIKLDRPVKGHAPLAVNRGPSASKGDDIFVIGHPVGLPVKLAGGANVRESDKDKGFFEANLDTYGGNSGSAVFNAETHLIEGILVRGETDFITTAEGCRISNVIPNTEGRGEDVTKVSVLSSFIPKLFKNMAMAEENMLVSINPLDGMDDFGISMPVFE